MTRGSWAWPQPSTPQAARSASLTWSGAVTMARPVTATTACTPSRHGGDAGPGPVDVRAGAAPGAQQQVGDRVQLPASLALRVGAQAGSPASTGRRATVPSRWARTTSGIGTGRRVSRSM